MTRTVLFPALSQPAVCAAASAAAAPAPQAPAVHVNVPRQSVGTEVAPRLDAEKLEVYHVALELQALSSTLVPAHHRVIRDQLERASLSCVLTLAEGAGRHSRREKRRYYSMSRGSAMEVAAIVDVLRLRRLAPESVCDHARSLALRTIQMLTKLSDALAP